MRVIKFRGQNYKGTWYRGQLVTHGRFWCIEDAIKVVRINPKTIGQFTGMTDMDGKEIWEGDIIEARLIDATLTKDNVKRGVVVYNDTAAAFCLNDASGFPKGLLCTTEQISLVKVIGNIYDNKELL